VRWLIGCAALATTSCGAVDPGPERWQLAVVLPPNPLDPSLTGKGSVTVGAASLECAGCNVGVEKGHAVVLTAVPKHGSAFHSWRSVPADLCANPRDATCAFTPSADARLEAYFVTRATNLWAASLGGPEYDEATAVVADPQGNVFVTGCMSGAVSLGNKKLTSHGDCDACVHKLDTHGNVLASAALGGAEEDRATHIALLPDGGVAVGGFLSGQGIEVTLPDQSVITTDPDGDDAFVALFDAELTYRGIWHLHGAGSQDLGSLAATASGEVFVFGSGGSKLDLGQSEITATRFVAKLTSSGTVLWARELPPLAGWTAAVGTSGKLVLVGNYETSMSFGGSCPELSANSGTQGYVAMLDGEGVCEKARKIAGQNELASLAAVTTDQQGHVIVAGRFAATIHLDPADPNAVAESEAISPAFVAKLGSDLAWVPGISFVRAFDAAQAIVALAVDDDDGIMLGVNLRSAWPNVPSYYQDIVLSKLDPSGELVFLRQFGSPSAESVAALAWDPSTRGWVIAGQHGDALFDAPIDFGGIDPNPLSFELNDALVAKFSP
jgi:hypothetical protein